MRIILIEDEGIAIRRLTKLIHEINPEIEIIAELESVYAANEWFSTHTTANIDLVLSDIQLSDGLAFEIFENSIANFPIIFTTAYDEYALRAFKVNGVDYLLKPIQKEELIKSFEKLERTKKDYVANQLADIQSLMKHLQQSAINNPSFISYQKDKLVPLNSEVVAYFYTQNQIVYAVVDKTEYVLDDKMEEIEMRLPSSQFFRANRQFIIQKKFVTNAEQYFNNRLLVRLSVKTPEDIIISREKTALFKKWLLGT